MEKVCTSPGATRTPRSPVWTLLMAVSVSSASHDFRPVTVISVPFCACTVADMRSRVRSVPLAMVPETVTSCPEPTTSGDSESIESVTRPSIIWAAAGSAESCAVEGAGTAHAAVVVPSPVMQASRATAATTVASRRTGERRGRERNLSGFTRPPRESHGRRPRCAAHWGRPDGGRRRRGPPIRPPRPHGQGRCPW